MAIFKKGLALASTAAMALALAACTTTEAPTEEGPAQSATLRLGHCVNEDHAFHAYAEAFQEQVQADTNGVVTVELYPNCELGNEVDMLDLMGNGDVDVAIVYSASAASTAPAMGFLAMPFLVDDMDHWERAFSNPEVLDYLNEAVARSTDSYEIAAIANYGYKHLYTNGLVPEEISDFQGLKMRLSQSPTLLDSWSALGVAPIALPFPELYSALESGLVDAAENALDGYRLGAHQEVAPFVSLTEHEVATTLILIRPGSLDGVDEATRAAVMQAALDNAPVLTAAGAANNQSVIDEFEGSVDFIEVGPALREAMREAMAPVQQRFAQELDMQGLVDLIAAAR